MSISPKHCGFWVLRQRCKPFCHKSCKNAYRSCHRIHNFWVRILWGLVLPHRWTTRKSIEEFIIIHFLFIEKIRKMQINFHPNSSSWIFHEWFKNVEECLALSTNRKYLSSPHLTLYTCSFCNYAFITKTMCCCVMHDATSSIC